MSLPVNAWEGRSHQGFHYYQKCFKQDVSWESILNALSYSLSHNSPKKSYLEEFEIAKNNVVASKYTSCEDSAIDFRSGYVDKPIKLKINSDITSLYRIGVTDYIQQKILKDFYTRVNEVHDKLKAVVEEDSAALEIALGKTVFPYKKYNLKTGIVNLQGKDDMWVFLINEKLHLNFQIVLQPGDYIVFPEETFFALDSNNPWAAWTCKIKEIDKML